MTKLTDYGFLLLSYLARRNGNGVPVNTAEGPAGGSLTGADPELSSPRLYNARDLARRTNLPLPVVGKVLKQLTKAELLVSYRGVKGGYGLARSPHLISAAEVISALEGPIAITQCSEHPAGNCEMESNCQVGGHWQRINHALHETLEAITLAELTDTQPPSDALYLSSTN